MKVGLYIVDEEPWRTAYFVHKVMPKTVTVAIRTSNWKNGDSPLSPDECISKEMHYRYPKSLLQEQIKTAEYRPFSEWHMYQKLQRL